MGGMIRFVSVASLNSKTRPPSRSKIFGTASCFSIISKLKKKIFGVLLPFEQIVFNQSVIVQQRLLLRR